MFDAIKQGEREGLFKQAVSRTKHEVEPGRIWKLRQVWAPVVWLRALIKIVDNEDTRNGSARSRRHNRQHILPTL